MAVNFFQQFIFEMKKRILCFRKGVEAASFVANPTNSYANSIPTIFEINPFRRAVLIVLSSSEVAKIHTSIVESVTVPVITKFVFGSSSDQSVHCDAGVSPATRIDRTPNSRSTPFPLIQPIEIVCIDNGEQAFCDWDKSVKWVRRHNTLRNQVGHSQPSTADVMCRHFSVLAVLLLTGCHSLIVLNCGIANKSAAALAAPMTARAYCLALLAPDLDIHGHSKGRADVSTEQRDFCNDVLGQPEKK
jgi:hypothetical protein